MNMPSDLAARERKERKAAMFSLRSVCSFAATFVLAGFSSVALADDAITNVMSPAVSYQYYEALGEDTNATIISRIVSYQYFDWAGNDVQNLQNSPVVSYFWQSGNQSRPLICMAGLRTPTASPFPA